MAATFADYLATLEVQSLPLHSSIERVSSCEEGSPLKRPRSDSPDTSVCSSTSFFIYESASTLSPAASTCVLRSILTPTPSSPLSSPPISRPLSRRSSTSGTSATSKSVRFARCTNASVFPCLSSADYDRSSIIPTCESESLELPRRKRSEAEGWIKCVERERAAAAKQEGTTSGLCTSFSPVPLPVEGVHGLIEGGYFRGDESGMEFDDMIMTDDGTTTDDEVPQPALVRDDSSGDDSDGVLSIASADVVIGMTGPTSTPAPKPAHLEIPLLSVSPVEPKALGFGFLERSSYDEASDEEKDEPEFHPEDLDHEEEDETRKVDRYGLCALGKYTRADLFSSHDSLGGF